MVAPLKALHPSLSIGYTLFTCIERVTFAAGVNFELWFSRACGEGIAAKAGYPGIVIIFRMYLGFHS